jgi:hypothetical protein
MTSILINAQTRGHLRLWLQNAERRYLTLEQRLSDKETDKAARSFAKSTDRGRMRAWLVLQRSFQDVAWLEAVNRTGRYPLVDSGEAPRAGVGFCGTGIIDPAWVILDHAA